MGDSEYEFTHTNYSVAVYFIKVLSLWCLVSCKVSILLIEIIIYTVNFKYKRCMEAINLLRTNLINDSFYEKLVSLQIYLFTLTPQQCCSE